MDSEKKLGFFGMKRINTNIIPILGNDVLMNIMSFLAFLNFEPIVNLSWTCKDMYQAVFNFKLSKLIPNAVDSYRISFISSSDGKCISHGLKRECMCWIKKRKEYEFDYKESNCTCGGGKIIPKSKFPFFRQLSMINNSISCIDSSGIVDEKMFKRMKAMDTEYGGLVLNSRPIFRMVGEKNDFDLNKFVLDYAKSYGTTAYNDYLKICGIPELKSVKTIQIHIPNICRHFVSSKTYFEISGIGFNISISKEFNLGKLDKQITVEGQTFDLPPNERKSVMEKTTYEIKAILDQPVNVLKHFYTFSMGFQQSTEYIDNQDDIRKLLERLGLPRSKIVYQGLVLTLLKCVTNTPFHCFKTPKVLKSENGASRLAKHNPKKIKVFYEFDSPIVLKNS